MSLDVLITTASLPMLDPGKVYSLQQIIRAAIEEYYERNTIRGCTDGAAPNFNYQVRRLNINFIL